MTPRERDNAPPQWSDNEMLAELERSLIWSQALTMANHAELLRRTARRLGAHSSLADLLSSEADRVLQSIEEDATRPDRARALG